MGINPGLRSAALGHHFAGHSNRFWQLLHESGLVGERLTFADDRRLLEWRLGLTNLVPRPTRGIDEIEPAEYRRGRRALERKIRGTVPALVGLIGVTLARVLGSSEASSLGLQDWQLAECPVFVVPNPSGRNAHYSYAAMLDAFSAMRAHAGLRPQVGNPRRVKRAAP